MTRPDAEDADRDLVHAFSARRDELAFRALYRRHTPFLYAMACRAVGGPGPGAEELVQDTWVRATERLETFEWRSRFRTWLGGILLNCRREALRREAVRPSAELGPEQPGAPPPHEPIDLEDALTHLADGYREVVVLHYVYGYKHHEIASLLGISTGTSKSQAARGLKRLRALMSR